MVPMTTQETIARVLLRQYQHRGIIAKYKTWDTIETHQRTMFMNYAAEIIDAINEQF